MRIASHKGMLVILCRIKKFDCLPCKDLLQGVARVWMSWL